MNVPGSCQLLLLMVLLLTGAAARPVWAGAAQSAAVFLIGDNEASRIKPKLRNLKP